ncbi:MAG: MoaD/ThiS family protein [Chloroflexota bacterium]
MKITVKLAGGFVHTVGFSQKELDVEPGTTIADILVALSIDRARPMVIARNGHGASVDEQVSAGDRILVSPVFSGG